MKATKPFFYLLILITVLWSCKKNDDTKLNPIDSSNISNYDYKVLLGADKKVKEIVVSYNNNLNYKLTYQYFDKSFIQNTYSSNNDLILAKYYYMNDSSQVDSSTFFGINTNNSILNDTTFSYYKYTNSILSEIDYVRYYSSLVLIGNDIYDTVRKESSGFLSFEIKNNEISSNMDGSLYSYSNIKNVIGLSILNFDLKHNIDFGFNSQNFGNQENYLISKIQYYGSDVNVTSFSYTLDSNGYITMIEKTYPEFDYTKYEIVYYKSIYNFSYSFE